MADRSLQEKERMIIKAKTKEIELLDVETASRLEGEFALRHVEEIKGYEVKKYPQMEEIT